eukprot:5304426-Pyramimonas_sp.AAC.1
MAAEGLEGINSLMRITCARAPSMRIPLLSARVCIKKNCSDISARSCVELDGRVTALVNSPDVLNSFSIAPIPDDQPQPSINQCCRRTPIARVKALPASRFIINDNGTGVGYVFSVALG